MAYPATDVVSRVTELEKTVKKLSLKNDQLEKKYQEVLGRLELYQQKAENGLNQIPLALYRSEDIEEPELEIKAIRPDGSVLSDLEVIQRLQTCNPMPYCVTAEAPELKNVGEIDGKIQRLNVKSIMTKEESKVLSELISRKHTIEKLQFFEAQDEWILKRLFSLRDSMKHLIMSYSHLGEDKGCVIAEALEKNRTITKLELRGCNLGRRTGRALTRALLSNRTLEHLDVTSNKMQTSFVEVLRSNPVISSLRFNVADLSKEQKEELKEVQPGMTHFTKRAVKL